MILEDLISRWKPARRLGYFEDDFLKAPYLQNLVRFALLGQKNKDLNEFIAGQDLRFFDEAAHFEDGNWFKVHFFLGRNHAYIIVMHGYYIPAKIKKLTLVQYDFTKILGNVKIDSFFDRQYVEECETLDGVTPHPNCP
jgi:hypothetical protein